MVEGVERGSNPEPAPTKEPPVQRLRDGSIMNQPQRAPLDSLKTLPSVENIVRAKTDKEALPFIRSCKDAKTLRIAHKQLRELGMHLRAMKVERRLTELPPGF